jgi:glycosyltransferase involved in cell wall biosynthesis
MQSHATSPLFSVIIPLYNRAHLIGRAIESVLGQSFKEFELIVVDDGSTDGGGDVAANYPGVRVLRQPNRGVAAARNAGIKAARGSIIALLDSDDVWRPEHLATHYRFFAQNPDYLIHQTDEVWIRDGRFLNKKKIHQKKGGMIFAESCRLCLISPSAVAMRRRLFDEVGLFDEDFEVCEDYELWLRVTRRYEVGYTPKATVIKYGGHADQLSRKHYGMDRWRVRALLRHIDRPEALDEAIRKCEVLLTGARKHKNEAILQEFEPIYEMLVQKRALLDDGL